MKSYKFKNNRSDADRIRQAVFLDEQQFSTEFDEQLDDQFQYITAYQDDICVGCVRYQIKDKIGILGRLAVLSEYRGLGFGKELVELTQQRLKELGVKEIHLHAQEPRMGFYHNLGYDSFGEMEMDEYMPHYWMKKEVNDE